MRVINVAAAQMGPIQKADSREAVVKRMIALMDEAKAGGADLIVYPELALTTFFPRWYMEDRAEADGWFAREMPNAATKPLIERAAQHQMAMSFGYAELTTDGHHFNTCILTDKSASIVGTYPNAHLPCHALDGTRWYFGSAGLHRPPLAGDLSRHGPARRRDGADRLQHAVGQFPEKRGGAREAVVPQSPVRAGRRLSKRDVGRARRQSRRRRWFSVDRRQPCRPSGWRDRRRGQDRRGRTPALPLRSRPHPLL